MKEHLKGFPPEKMAEICGIDAETLRAVARDFATAKSGMIFWGMGISQHVHGTDNSRCLISLALMCGHVGRPGTGCIRSGVRTTCRARRMRASSRCSCPIIRP